MKDNKNSGSEVQIKTKHKSLYYIVIAACALVLVAAITLTVVFTTMGTKTVDNPGNDANEPGGGTDEPEEPDGPEKPSNVEVVFSMPVSGATVSTTYSFWFNSTLNRYSLHQGVDFKADAGTQVTAAYEGTVKSVTDTLLEGGKVVIDHGNGLLTEYASIDVAADLKAGDKVKQGDVLGTVSAGTDVMGNEYNEGAHLHFAVMENGKNIDPATYLDVDEK